MHETPPSVRAITVAQPVISVSERPPYGLVVSRKSGKEIIPDIDLYADGRWVDVRDPGVLAELEKE